MKQMTSGVSTTEYNTAFWNIRKAAQAKLLQQRAQSTPTAGLVNNFDPDQKGFLTAPMQGFTMLQVGAGAATYGTLAVQTSHGVKIPAKPQYDLMYFSDTGFNLGNRKGFFGQDITPQPGQPYPIYPAASSGPAFNTNFVAGGKADLVRTYPQNLLVSIRVGGRQSSEPPYEFLQYNPNGEHAVMIREDAISDLSEGGFIHTDFINAWIENSPIPPGVRYTELGDTSFNENFAPYNLDILLPHDSEGNIRRNIKPLALVGFSNDQIDTRTRILQDDYSYWTGTVKDPLNWRDPYWDIHVDYTKMAAYLQAHPACKL